MPPRKRLIDVFPDLWNELDDSKNNYKCDKKDIPYRSNIIYWWVCKKCDWSWKTRVSNRYASVVSTNGNKTGCPMCAGKILTEDNKLSTVRPGIAEDWDYIKNKDITPDNTLYGSHRRVWWLCSKCLFSWRTSVEGRAKKKGGCPSCSNKAVSHTNNLNEMCPDVAKEWDYERNYPLKPTDLVFGSHIRCWWTCSLCGHHWNTILYSRTGNAKSGCPACAGQDVTEERNLEKLFPDVAKEWDYSKNNIKPYNVLPGCNTNVWWLCSKCNYSWKTSPNHRISNKSGCPRCIYIKNASRISSRWLDMFCISQDNREKRIKCGMNNFRVDGYDPKNNMIYEFLGDYWHGNPKDKRFPPNSFNKQAGKTFGELYNDWLDKKKVLETYGYKVIYIWESEFKNFERQGVKKCE